MINLDLNQIPNEEHDETLENEPFVGQAFSNFEEAHLFYKNYAMQHGFAIRKDRSEKKKDKFVRRDIYCHRGGKRSPKAFDPSKDQRNRGSMRCGCNAHVRLTLKKSCDIFPEEWHVTKFIKDHNHELLSKEEMRFLPVNRIITSEDEDQILLYKEAELNVRQIIRVMELQKQVKHGDLSFFEKDVRNLFTKVKNKLGDTDAMSLINHMKSLKEENDNFQYVYTIDEEKRLENIFWCHSESFDWYVNYGDVVAFDTTYKVNAYDMPCALFVGINNHGKTVLFGSALLRNETKHTFSWLMNTFVMIMKKPPKAIITDQDQWMSEAIAIEMPTTKHSYCIWHITGKFSSWFTALLRTEYQSWCADFYKVYRMNSIEEFEYHWSSVISKYNLVNNKHVIGLYKIRKSWAPAYLRDYFFGGMVSTSRSESVNGFIKKFVSSHTSLKDFVRQIYLAVEEIKNGESQIKMLTTVRSASIKVKSPLEEQASKILTPFAFKKFQEEFERASQYLINQVDGDKFIVKYFNGENHKSHNVQWDGSLALCTCKNFEFWGILCRHIFRVLTYKDCFKIPPVYLPLHWCCKSLHGKDVSNDVTPNNQPMIEELIQSGENVLCPPKSKTKGRPKIRRLKGGKELASKSTKRCSICRESGHTKPTCKIYKYGFGLDAATSSERQNTSTPTEDICLNPILTTKY
ncbi:protein FAR1-RELATED SEQUENCE 11-like [Rutidosis leptorrhynchoides]|uniref:protein FAR1-RELATED SEQUENCE 11-like n=1 Tax=Rutidosis leptorrhynchoides TaxID=125765 RepID=UPI003A998D2C